MIISNDILDNFELINQEYLPDTEFYNLKSSVAEYRLYSYLTTFFNNIVILDIGTYTGRSAMALSHNPTNKVISYDIGKYFEDTHKIHSKQNITFKVKNVMDDLNNDLISKTKIIMIDIDHFGKTERIILDKLKELNYSGIVLLDDIYHPKPRFNWRMKKLWNNITEEKYDMTKYGHFSGTGLVVFNSEFDFKFE